MRDLLRTYFKDDRGSTLVFLCIMLASLISAAIVMITVTRNVVQIGYVDSVVSLAGRSALTEYIPELQKRYGLFAACSLAPEEDRRIAKYCNYSFAKKRALKVERLRSNLEDHSYTDLNVFVEDVKDALAFELIHGLKKKDKNPQEDAKRVLRNRRIISCLPSQNEGEFSDGDIGLLDGASLDQYILSLFNNGLFKRAKGETFFRNEVEYIICGHYSDKKNYKRFGLRIAAIRTPFNAAFIYRSPDMMARVTAAGQALAPGPGGVIAQAFIISAWAGMESRNDVEILRHGGKVPIMKTKSTWAIDIDMALKADKEEYIDTHSPTGLEYEDYLRSQLLIENKKQKILRMMDVMQINIQGTYDKDFQMSMAHRGLDINARVSGRDYAYQERY